MSSSNIQCRQCGHTLAKRNHHGVVKFMVGIRVEMLRDGQVRAHCPCGSHRVILPTERRAA